MKGHGYIITCGMVCLLTFMTSCAGTRLTRTYVDENYKNNPVSNILVIGIADKDRHRRLFERRFVSQLQAVGVKATASADNLPMPADLKLKHADIRDAVRKLGNDAVIITHIIGIENNETITRHQGLSSNLYDYYGSRYDNHLEAGYSRTTTTVRLETSLYDVKTENLVWSGLSKTWNRDSADQVIDDVVKTVIKDLNKNRLITPD